MVAVDLEAPVEEVSEADILSYVIEQTNRPPTLVEDYHLIWPNFSGILGPNESISTTEPLNLDPFHRSNPFRHAFHQKHVAGFAITRSMTITFDPDQEAGILTGTYEETITGLTASGIVLRGDIRLERVSVIGVLE